MFQTIGHSMCLQHLTNIWNNWKQSAFALFLLKVIWITKCTSTSELPSLNLVWICLLVNLVSVIFFLCALWLFVSSIPPYTALRDHRIELVRASWQELTIRIGDVSLSDEGQYTCSLFTMPVKTTKAFLTVLGEHFCFGPVSTGQLLVANSSCSDSMNTWTFWIIVCCFSSACAVGK